jgi:spore coat polysaccharide biosynthesis predicted glycosyltransferase SpsG
MTAGLHLVLSADATRSSGAGHAMRLAVLGEAWARAGGTVSATGQIDLPFVAERYQRLGITLGPDRRPTDLMVVDTYDSAARFRATQTGGIGTKVLVDDLGVDVPPAFDAVWNPNAYGNPAMYHQFAGAVLTGPDCLAVRDDLPRWHEGGKEIVVSVGGGEPPPEVTNAFRQLAHLAPEHRFGMTGDWAPDGWRTIPRAELWTAAAGARHLITAAGTTVWEAAAVGVPVVLLMIAENQRLVYRWARDAGVPGLNATLIDAEFLAHQLRALIGVACALPPVANGAHRVVERLVQLVRAARSGR